MFTKICSSTSKPVTAKIRLGWSDDSINFLENIRALETQQNNYDEFSLNPYLRSTHPFMLKSLFPFISLLLY